MEQKDQEFDIQTTSTSTFTLRTVTQGVRMLKKKIDRINGKLVNAFFVQNGDA
jgi:hypothetical protein